MTPIERRYNYLCDAMKEVSGIDIRADKFSHKRDISFCRFIVMKKLRDEGYTFESIGEVFDKDYSTIINGVGKLNTIIQYPSPSEKEIINTFNTFIQYADRQVEIKLSAYEFETLKSVLQKFLAL